MKEKAKSDKIVGKQLEFDFSDKYYIQWHSINESSKIKRGYKSRVKKLVDIVDNSVLYFDNLKSAIKFVEHLCCSFLEHHYSDNLMSGIKENLFTEFSIKDDSTYSFTVKGESTHVTYWIEVNKL